MIRAYAGLLALDCLLLATGASVLFALGLLRGRSGWRLAGLAFLVGWACFGVLDSLALVAGLAVTVPEAVVLCAALSVAAAANYRRIPAARPALALEEQSPWLRLLGLGAAALLAAYLVALLVQALVAPADPFWDSWAFWLPKAKSIYFFGGLDTGPGAFTSFANRDYPPLLPGMDATAFHFMGGVHPAALPVQGWALAAAFVAAVAALLGRRVPAGILWPSLATIVVMPRFAHYALSALADAPLALMLGLAAVCAALWLLDGDRRHAALCGVFLAASALLKNEGLLFGLFLVLALGVAVLFETRTRWRTVLALAAVPLLAILPWKIWLGANGEPTSSPYYRFSDLLHPGYLAGRAHRLGTAVYDLPQYLLAPHRWLLTVPLAVAAAVLVARRRPGLALLPVGFVVLALLGTATIYWISSIPVDWYIATSAERVVLSMVVVAGALFPLLLAEAPLARRAAAPAYAPGA
jgi:hypothetical protein